ncbi:light harvesting complex photosystem II [Actinidia rufa]|uniref:Chlorophyll a-b binding protein, chloroplastic n=1 Tax=Actinidia rufa TaxID=165716 RepID=A0A7J0F3A3_9ERIC|nr:light harvesting complex photosystem II [Actinidia rufa]
MSSRGMQSLTQKKGSTLVENISIPSDLEKKTTLQLAEIKHACLAMVGFLGFAIQAATTGKGPLNNWATFFS